MQISSKSRHALRALVELELRTDGRSRPVRVVDLASERGLPKQFPEHLFAAWREAVAAFEAVLAHTTITDLAERERQQGAGQPAYQI